MKHFLCILLIIPLIAFSGSCSGKSEDSQKISCTPVEINSPKDDTVNGYRTEKPETSELPEIIEGNQVTPQTQTPSKENPSDNKYCANKNSKVFHNKDCGSVSNIKESNKIYFGDRNQLISQGYSPCKRCNP